LLESQRLLREASDVWDTVVYGPDEEGEGEGEGGVHGVRGGTASGGRGDGDGGVAKDTSISTSRRRNRGTTLVRRGRTCGCGSS
jgi:hypothetical protein